LLLVHEEHEVRVGHEQEFERCYRQGWVTALANSDFARLLWYFDQATGTGRNNVVVTITTVPDLEAWQKLERLVGTGDLRDWRQEVDRHRQSVNGKLLEPAYWSPLQEVDLVTVPTGADDHPVSMYMEDTGWPWAPLEDYIRFNDEMYFQIMSRAPAEQKLLDIQGFFTTAWGAGRSLESLFMQKVLDYDQLIRLLARPERYDPDEWPGSYMVQGLKYRDQWRSRLLRTSPWSPYY
jgi:hypothetical protein